MLRYPSLRAWITTGSMAAARQSHSATVLTDGRVLVAGGQGLPAHLSSAELYDPTNGITSPGDFYEHVR